MTCSTCIGLETRKGPADWLLPTLGAFTVGMLVGAGIGLLIAPKPGAAAARRPAQPPAGRPGRAWPRAPARQRTEAVSRGTSSPPRVQHVSVAARAMSGRPSEGRSARCRVAAPVGLFGGGRRQGRVQLAAATEAQRRRVPACGTPPSGPAAVACPPRGQEARRPWPGCAAWRRWSPPTTRGSSCGGRTPPRGCASSEEHERLEQQGSFLVGAVRAAGRSGAGSGAGGPALRPGGAAMRTSCAQAEEKLARAREALAQERGRERGALPGGLRGDPRHRCRTGCGATWPRAPPAPAAAAAQGGRHARHPPRGARGRG